MINLVREDNSVDRLSNLIYPVITMVRYSTRQAAQKLGLSFPTLNRYIGKKQIPVPAVQEIGGGKFRVWTEADIERVRKILPKIVNGRKTRYQKQKGKNQKPQPRSAVPHKQPKK